METVDFAKVQIALPTLCFILVQNVTPEEQKQAADQIKPRRLSSEFTSFGDPSQRLAATLLRLAT